MARPKIAIIGAGSRSFGPATIRDIFLSKPLKQAGVRLVLMDKIEKHVSETAAYARAVNRRTGGNAAIESTTSLKKAVDGAAAVVSAIEVDRYLYWAMDFHVPRKYGFRQPYGENGGPGGDFHALRNMGPTIEIARAMEKLAPGAPLLNYTNPEPKLVEAVSRLTRVPAIGLCHGIGMGIGWVSTVLGKPVKDMEYAACGLNHFTWFQTLRDRKTGKDLYPDLAKADREGDWLAHWEEIALARVLFRRFGLWPSPGTNHFGEYIRWADEFLSSNPQYFYDPADGHPWQGKVPVPEFIYSLEYTEMDRPFMPKKARTADDWNPDARGMKDKLEPSGELGAVIMESVLAGVPHDLDAMNVPNRGAIPNLPDDMVVEVPGTSDRNGCRARRMAPLPEPIAALLRTQASINKLLVEAYAEQSKAKLLQAILLEPTVHTYRGAVEMVDEMIGLQKSILPPLA